MREVTRAGQVYGPGTRIIDIPPTAERKFAGAVAIFTRDNRAPGHGGAAWPAGQDYVESMSGIVRPDTVLAVKLVSSLDGASFEPVFEIAFPGGLRKHPTSEFRCAFDPRDGDLRFTFINLVSLYTAITMRLLEPGEAA